jgi:hypothetical protein
VRLTRRASVAQTGLCASPTHLYDNKKIAENIFLVLHSTVIGVVSIVACAMHAIKLAVRGCAIVHIYTGLIL